MAPSALILLADGSEEMEFTIPFDTLVRAGISVTSAFVLAKGQPKPNAVSPIATASRGMRIQADVLFDEGDLKLFGPAVYDVLIVPGGAKGAETISQSVQVQQLVREYLESDKYVGMICAGSLTALTAKLPAQPLTSHPSVQNQLDKDFDYKEDSVVISGKLVTSRGPGTAFPFALTLVELLVGPEKRKEVRDPMIFPANTPF